MIPHIKSFKKTSGNVNCLIKRNSKPGAVKRIFILTETARL